jgi:hypothetical protein
MCDHCGCRQGSIGRLMDQHEQITAYGAQVRHGVSVGDEPAARAAFALLLAVLEPHNAWEERGLFARMAAQGDFADHVSDLVAEHEQLHTAIADAETAPEGWGAAIVELLDRLDAHIYRENFGLFPGAIAVLDADDWDAIIAAEPIPAG